jgi:hypothetical protein
VPGERGDLSYYDSKSHTIVPGKDGLFRGTVAHELVHAQGGFYKLLSQYIYTEGRQAIETTSAPMRSAVRKLGDAALARPQEYEGLVAYSNETWNLLQGATNAADRYQRASRAYLGGITRASIAGDRAGLMQLEREYILASRDYCCHPEEVMARSPQVEMFGDPAIREVLREVQAASRSGDSRRIAEAQLAWMRVSGYDEAVKLPSAAAPQGYVRFFMDHPSPFLP